MNTFYSWHCLGANPIYYIITKFNNRQIYIPSTGIHLSPFQCHAACHNVSQNPSMMDPSLYQWLSGHFQSVPDYQCPAVHWWERCLVVLIHNGLLIFLIFLMRMFLVVHLLEHLRQTKWFWIEIKKAFIALD